MRERLVEVMVEILNRHRQSYPHRRVVSMQMARPLGHADSLVVAHGVMLLEVQAERDQNNRKRMVGIVGKKERKLLQTVGIVALKLGLLALDAVSATDGTMCSEDMVVGDLVLRVAAFRVQVDMEEEEEDRCGMVLVPDCKLGGESSGAKVLLPHSSEHADLPPLTQAELVVIPRRQKTPKVRDRGAGGGLRHCQRC